MDGALRTFEMTPADLLRLWLLRRRFGALPTFRWRARTTLWGTMSPPADLVGLSPTTRLRIARLWAALEAMRCGRRVPLCVEAFVAAACFGRMHDALARIDDWVEGRPLGPAAHRREARARRARMHRVRRMLARGRQEGDLRIWMDLPAGLVPFAAALEQRLLGGGPHRILSGGDRLHPGAWIWEVESGGWGEVLSRARPCFRPRRTLCAHRDAFEPASGGRG